jgi:hypothetical protein
VRVPVVPNLRMFLVKCFLLLRCYLSAPHSHNASGRNIVSETWNREELYIEIWEKPLVKVAVKYNISAVALGKVCRKLQIPLPGRGHWTKKEFGKPVAETPLPTATNLPVVRKMKEAYTRVRGTSEVVEPVDESDPELVRIAAVRKAEVPINEKANLHKIRLCLSLKFICI